MIKFFRHIRQHLLSEGKTGKYIKYAIGEIILVVIGILIALSLNNWNSKRLATQRNGALLAKLSKELDLNIDRAANLDSIWDDSFTHRLKFTDSLKTLLDNDMLASDLDYVVSQTVFYVNTFNLNTSVFEELKNTGSLYAIGTDSLVTEIQGYYQLCDRESFYNLNYSETCIALRLKCFEGFIDFKYMYKRDPEQAVIHHPWIRNPRAPEYIHFRQYVHAARNHSELMSRKLKGIIKESQKLKENIEAERNRKNFN